VIQLFSRRDELRKRLTIAGAALGVLAAGGLLSAAAFANAGSEPAELHPVPLDELEVPIVDSGRLDGTLRVRFVLNAVDDSTADALGDRQPELRSLALGAATEFGRIYASGLAPVNAEILKQKVKAAIVQGHPGVADVLVVQVSASPS
jgi:flagellar basal body-associated protein FliL